MLVNFWFTAAYSQTQEICRLVKHEDRKVLLVEMRSEMWGQLPSDGHKMNRELIQVYVTTDMDGEISPTQPAITGQYLFEGNKCIFLPILPFRDDLYYKVYLKDQLFCTLQHPLTPKESRTRITGIYPSTDTVPENLLKLYVQFSGPMSDNPAYTNLLLTNEHGDTITEPFLKLEPELWDQNHERLTIWLDPGRIKRDLGPNQAWGAPLVAGQLYTLTILPTWRDIHGNELEQIYRKQFRATVADRRQPEINDWQLKLPAAHSTDALIVHFPEALDYALLQHAIQVITEESRSLPGKVEVFDDESKWSFTPSGPWQYGSYKLSVNTILEDLAGNNLNRLFDRDLTLEVENLPEREVVSRTFQIER